MSQTSTVFLAINFPSLRYPRSPAYSQRRTPAHNAKATTIDCQIRVAITKPLWPSGLIRIAAHGRTHDRRARRGPDGPGAARGVAARAGAGGARVRAEPAALRPLAR